MKRGSTIALILTLMLIVLSVILLQFPCQSSFPFPSICPTHAVYLIFNFPAVIVGLLIIQILPRPADYVNTLYFIAIFVNAIWWFFLIRYFTRRKAK
jgi:hypothetical protein